MRKLAAPFKYLLMIALLSAFWAFMLVLGLAWVGNGHGLLEVDRNLRGNDSAWVMLVLLAMGWLTSVLAALAIGPRMMLDFFRHELGSPRF